MSIVNWEVERMQNRLFRKSLVIGVIILFVGVGFQPVFARETIIKTADSEEDCGCQSVNNINLGLE